MRKKTHKEFEEEFDRLVGDEYVLLGRYISIREKIKVLHKVCGTEDFVTVNYFMKNHGSCKHCRNVMNGIKKRKSHSDFVKEVFDLVGDEYSVVSEYKGKGEYVNIKHNYCGTIRPVLPNNFLSKNSRCGNCFGKHQKTTEDFKQEVFAKVGDEYSVLGEYKSALDKIKISHNTCGHSWYVRPNDFISSNSRCPECSSFGDSKGARRVRRFLDESKIPYVAEYRIAECKYKRVLPFDFKVELNGTITLIEFDGEQHFRITFGNEMTFQETQIRDRIKNEYCRKNGIKLIRIPYWEYDNIETILNRELGLVLS